MDFLVLICHQSFVEVFIDVAFVVTELSPHSGSFLVAESVDGICLLIEFFRSLFHVQIEVTEDHILRRSNDRLAVFRT